MVRDPPGRAAGSCGLVRVRAGTLQEGIQQRGSRNIKDLADAQEFHAGRGAVLAFDLRDVGLVDLGLRGEFFLGQMGTTTGRLHKACKVTWMNCVLRHGRAYSSPRGLALQRMCLMVIFVTLTRPSRGQQAQNTVIVDCQSYRV